MVWASSSHLDDGTTPEQAAGGHSEHGGSSSAGHHAGHGAGHGGGQRLNLLISCASWRHDSWADRLPCLLEPMGVHSIRARSAKQAEKVIRSAPVHIAVVDLGLPLEESAGGSSAGRTGVSEEAGPRILELLSRLESPPPTVVVKGPRTQRDESRNLNAALRCGAFAVVDRGAVDVEQMLEVLRRCLTKFYQGMWPTGPATKRPNHGPHGGGGGAGGYGGHGGAGPKRMHWWWWMLG